MIIARQSTARTVMIGPVLDADGVAVTDCVVADFEGSVNGGDPAALNGSATLTHRGVGFYSLALTATDLGTVGSFEVTINDTTNACAIKELTVIEEAVYDALFAASANAFTGAAGSSKVTGVVLTDTVTTYTGNTPQTGDAYAVVNSGTFGNAAIKTQTAAIEADTQDVQSRLPAALTGDGNIKADALRIGGTTQTGADVGGLVATVGAAGAGLTAADDDVIAAIAALNNLSSAQAQTAAAAALTSYDPPTRTEATGDKDEILAATTAIQADLPQRITKNTALSGFTFLMVEDGDHVTPATGLTVTATRSLDGAAFGACANAVSEISNGFYKIDLAAGDLNGNCVALKFSATGADQRSMTLVTQPT
jgi:hypothetical protein